MRAPARRAMLSVMAANRQTEPRPLSDALDGVVRSLQGGRSRNPVGAAAVGGVFGRWNDIVGDAMAAQVQPVKLDAGRLLLEVSEPAWATQVRLLSDQLRQKIKDVAGVVVDSVDVRVADRRGR
jgi:predicted nucleic acid-binding Zn ribbon protein